MSIEIQTVLGRVSGGEDLSLEAMAQVVDSIMQGTWTDDQIALLLNALKQKGETVQEVAGAARALRSHMTPIRTHGVAESCNLCIHLLDRGKEPACVAKCKEIDVNAIEVGDLKNKTSKVSEQIRKHSPKRLREDLHTEPKVYYVGL